MALDYSIRSRVNYPNKAPVFTDRLTTQDLINKIVIYQYHRTPQWPVYSFAYVPVAYPNLTVNYRY
jgi:hypothetical protein